MRRISINQHFHQVCAHSIKFADIFFFSLLKPPPWMHFHPTPTLFSTSSHHKQPISSSSSSSSSRPLNRINQNHRHLPSQTIVFGSRGEEEQFQDLFLKLSHVSPETIRPFWRQLSTFKPHQLLHILLPFQQILYCASQHTNEEVVALLWKLFKWDFKDEEDHLPQSYGIMASMLTQVGLVREAESLLRAMELHGLLPSSQETLASNIIDKYVKEGNLNNSISLYSWMRARGFVPSHPCFQLLINQLSEMNKTQLALRVYRDMVELGIGLNHEDISTIVFVTKLLCREGKILEAKNLVKKLTASGFQPSCAVLDPIADGYCEKKDFEDLLNFLNEMRCAPSPPICNKILSCQCRSFGTEQAYLFMVELEQLGFSPDEITFSIFIRWSCRDGKVRDAFIYLSELLSRELKPDVHSYNALISGVFKEDLCKHANDIFHEMLERGIMPDLSTFRILLAGYCKFRHFDDAKAIIKEMVNRNLAQVSSMEDPVSKAFFILGFKPSAVKVKRDNGGGLWKAEFFDTLGNGLYLETDLDEYEKTVTKILEDAFVSDSNSLLLAECCHGNLKAALMVKDNMICRAEKLSFSAYSALVKGLSLSRSHGTKAFDLLMEMPEMANHLDPETLNSLVRAISKRGCPHKGRIILDMMLQRELPIASEAYTALIMSLCKKGNPTELRECWRLARKRQWLPSLVDSKALVECVCQRKMLEEVLDLLESMLAQASVHLVYNISIIFLEVLCSTGYTSIGLSSLEKFLGEGLVLNNMAYNHLIRGFCKEKRYQEALGLLETMISKNIAPCVDVYEQLIHHLCKRCRLEKCMTLKKIMLAEEPTACVSVYYSLVSGLCKAGKIGLATVQFQEMLAKEVFLDADTYNIMVQGHCHNNNSRKVGELLGVMVRRNITISLLSFRNLVSLECRRNRVSHVLKLKEFMLSEIHSPLVLYNILIFRFSQMRSGSLITLILQDMNRKDLVPDEVAFNFLVCGYSKCKDISKALEALRAMSDKHLRPSNRSLTMVIRHLCSHRNLDKALELSRLMESRGWPHGSLVQHSIVEGLLSHDRFLEAENFLNRMKERGLIPNGVSYDILIKRFCWYGKPKVAVDLLNVTLKKGGVPNSTSYDSVIQALCNCNAVDEALSFHAEMLARTLKPSIDSWDVLINVLCRNGWTAESERLLDSMLQLCQTPTRRMYQFVIDRYCLENNPNKASQLLHKMQQNGNVPDFDTHWSLISNLSNSKNNNNMESGGFLSKLLSLSGFTHKKDTSKVG